MLVYLVEIRVCARTPSNFTLVRCLVFFFGHLCGIRARFSQVLEECWARNGSPVKSGVFVALAAVGWNTTELKKSSKRVAAEVPPGLSEKWSWVGEDDAVRNPWREKVRGDECFFWLDARSFCVGPRCV